MPGMNGKHLAERLRAQRPDLHALYLSGYTDNALGPSGSSATNPVPARG